MSHKKKKSNLRAKLIKNNYNGPFKFKGHLVIKLTTLIALQHFVNLGQKLYSRVVLHFQIRTNNSSYMSFFFLKIKLDLDVRDREGDFYGYLHLHLEICAF